MMTGSRNVVPSAGRFSSSASRYRAINSAMAASPARSCKIRTLAHLTDQQVRHRFPLTAQCAQHWVWHALNLLAGWKSMQLKCRIAHRATDIVSAQFSSPTRGPDRFKRECCNAMLQQTKSDSVPRSCVCCEATVTMHANVRSSPPEAFGRAGADHRLERLDAFNGVPMAKSRTRLGVPKDEELPSTPAKVVGRSSRIESGSARALPRNQPTPCPPPPARRRCDVAFLEPLLSFGIPADFGRGLIQESRATIIAAISGHRRTDTLQHVVR